jgi:hypothetical protein
MKYRAISVALSVAVLSGCVGIKTDSWQAPSADLSSLSTYTWDPGGLQTGSDAKIDKAFLTPLITEAAELLLNEKGYVKAEAKASFILKAAVQLTEKAEQTAPALDDESSPRGGLMRQGKLDWEWTPADGVNVSFYEEGALLLMVVDPASDKTLWQGSGRLRVDASQPPESKEATVRKVVRKVLRRFPERR